MVIAELAIRLARLCSYLVQVMGVARTFIVGDLVPLSMASNTIGLLGSSAGEFIHRSGIRTMWLPTNTYCIDGWPRWIRSTSRLFGVDGLGSVGGLLWASHVQALDYEVIVTSLLASGVLRR